MLTPILFRYIRPLLAIMITLGCIGFCYILLYRAYPETNREVLLLVAGYLLSKLGDITAYYYGNSKDKSDAEQAGRNNTSTATTTVTTPPDIPAQNQ